jgi:cell migration-inducing and hyaluronan-binding protein
VTIPIIRTRSAYHATQCPAATSNLGRYKCNGVNVCADGTTDPRAEANCAVTVLDHYTSAFNWANGNVSAVWLRPQWYLLDNSVLSDVQNGALTFITGGDYTHASVIQGYWALALDTFFIGHTQPQDPAHAFALDKGPFNNLSGVKCDPLAAGQGAPAYCLDSDDGISMPVAGFFANQRIAATVCTAAVTRSESPRTPPPATAIWRMRRSPGSSRTAFSIRRPFIRQTSISTMSTSATM